MTCFLLIFVGRVYQWYCVTDRKAKCIPPSEQPDTQTMNKPSIHCRTIVETDWQSILRIQAEVYYAIVPESESVMRSKANCSPETCLVATDSVLQFTITWNN